MIKIRVDFMVRRWERADEEENNRRPRLPRSGTLWKRKDNELLLYTNFQNNYRKNCTGIVHIHN